VPIPGALPPANLLQPYGLAERMPQLHPGILPARWRKVAFATTAKF
jgi:hypothetical protein